MSQCGREVGRRSQRAPFIYRRRSPHDEFAAKMMRTSEPPPLSLRYAACSFGAPAKAGATSAMKRAISSLT